MRQFYVWSSSKPLRLGPSAQREDAFSPLFGGITPDPNIELSSLSLDAGLTLITPEVPLWLAEVAAKVALPLLGSEKAGWQKRWRWLLCKIASERVRMAISAWDQQYTKPMGSLVSAASTLQPAQSCRTVAAQPVTTSEPGSTVLKILITRRLMEDEVRQALSQSEVGQLGTLRSSIHALVLAGYVQRESSVGVNWFGRLQCRRCGAEEIELTWCVRCGRECPVCRECRNMGMSRGCTPLYSLTDIGRRVAADILRTKCVPKVNLSFELSVAQKTAARQVEEALVSGAKDILVWAACGAGKTEVVYGAIRNTLAKSQRVLLVTPRRDVSAELCQRLKGVLGTEYVLGLYGGAEQMYSEAPVLVATTHQAIRLDDEFGLVILDECDAFPYNTEPALQRAIARLADRGGCFVQMTATPPRYLRKRNDCGLVYIPARHHGYPLPVPCLLIEPTLKQWRQPPKDGQVANCPPSLQQVLIESRREGGQLLLFVPSRAMVSLIVTAVQSVGTFKVAGVHSGTGARDEVRMAFASGELEVVVATTVFERGLTFPKADVAVFLADTARVFSSAALVQMAGRVGRTTQRPMGRVWFLCVRENLEIQQAVNDINELNRIAVERGLLQASP